jgi:nucleoside-diphosphate-sugar epimerase
MLNLITGGTGFIGRALVQRLLSEGEEIRLLVRSTSDLAGLDDKRIQLCPGDVTDRESLRVAASGCRQVFHLAAYAQSWAKDPSYYSRVNIEGTKNLLDACVEKKIDRIVMASTSVTLGSSSDMSHGESDGRDENSFATEYERSKYLAEKTALYYVPRGLSVVFVNPTRVYGPGKLTEANSVTKLIKMCLRQRACLILGQGREIGNYVFVDDVVTGMLAAMARGRAGERYILGGDNLSLNDFFGLLRKLSRKQGVRLVIPVRLALVFGRFEEWKARRLGIRPLVTREWVKNFMMDWAFSSEKARAELDYHPRSLEEGLKLTLSWLNSNPKKPHQKEHP